MIHFGIVLVFSKIIASSIILTITYHLAVSLYILFFLELFHQLTLLFSQEKVLLCMQRELLALRLEFTNSRRRCSMQMVTASSEDIYQLARAEDLCNKIEILG